MRVQSKAHSPQKWILKGISYVLMVGLVHGVFGQEEASVNQGAKPKLVYVCPPCGCPEDQKEFQEKGNCAGCQMTLEAVDYKYRTRVEVARGQTGPRKRVAILVFDGVQIIDYTGPFEIFGQANFEVFLVSKEQGLITTNMGMKVTTDHSFATCPEVDILLLPGGGIDETQNDAEAIAWLKKKAEATEHVISVCNGAFLLAETGLLDGKTATTFHRLIDSLENAKPKVKIIRDQRFVDNGKFITTAGLTSGMDGTLHLLSKINGPAFAQRIALNLEYNWNEDLHYARANFADKVLVPRILDRFYYPLMPAPGTVWKGVFVGGDSDHWKAVWEVTGTVSAEQLLRFFNEKLVTDGAWQRQTENVKGLHPNSQWRFRGPDGELWEGSVQIEPGPNKQIQSATLQIAKLPKTKAS